MKKSSNIIFNSNDSCAVFILILMKRMQKKKKKAIIRPADLEKKYNIIKIIKLASFSRLLAKRSFQGFIMIDNEKGGCLIDNDNTRKADFSFRTSVMISHFLES